MRHRKNKIWCIPKSDLENLAKSNNSLSAILRSIGLTTKGTSNFQSLKKRLMEESIDYSHIALGLGSNKGRKFHNVKKIPLGEILVEGSSFSRAHLKERLLEAGLLEYKCYICGLADWLNKPISLELDHINGISDDHRLENLRFLCPNCHSQTETFGCKRKKKFKVRVSDLDPRWRNRPNLKNRKVVRPSKERLSNMLWSIPTTSVARIFGVSDKAVEKWAKSYQITKPPRGYWNKIIAG